MSAESPLNITIVGGGIGGLTAAIGLRQSGHKVVLLEQRHEANEVGAAIMIGPNCNTILRRLGFFAEVVGANPLHVIRNYNEKEELISTIDVDGLKEKWAWKDEWLLVHRAHLHQGLTALALKHGAEIRYSSHVNYVDPHTASVYLVDGTTVHADVLIGADGVSSATRSAIPGAEHLRPHSAGENAFRFLLPRELVLADPQTKKFGEHLGEMKLMSSTDPERKLVMYTCDNNATLNFVFFYPEEKSDTHGDAWTMQASKSHLLEMAKTWSEDVRTLFSKVDETTLKLWTLRDMDTMPGWTEGQLALLGDAAHPFLPHQGQGGAQAMEDAVSLVVVLPRGVPKTEIADRLKLYEKTRLERAHRIQNRSRDTRSSADQSFIDYNNGWDEWEHSTGMLEAWEKKRASAKAAA